MLLRWTYSTNLVNEPAYDLVIVWSCDIATYRCAYGPPFLMTEIGPFGRVVGLNLRTSGTPLKVYWLIVMTILRRFNHLSVISRLEEISNLWHRRETRRDSNPTLLPPQTNRLTLSTAPSRRSLHAESATDKGFGTQHRYRWCSWLLFRRSTCRCFTKPQRTSSATSTAGWTTSLLLSIAQHEC